MKGIEEAYMLWKPLALLHSNRELANYVRATGRFSSAKDLRTSVPIAVIDDQNFSPGDNLRSFGYKIDQLGDIRRISDVADYRIVLCDLMGVGKFFDHQKQGASLIEEIRTHYPSIIVVAYTGSSLGSVPAKAAKDSADLIIKKDIDTSEWKETLDNLARRAVDPYFVWSRTRERLIATDVDTKAILMMEHAYVAGVLGRDKDAAALKRVAASLDLGPDVRAVIQGIVSAAIFGLIVS